MKILPLLPATRAVLLALATFNLSRIVVEGRVQLDPMVALPLEYRSFEAVYRLWTYPFMLPTAAGGVTTALFTLTFTAFALSVFEHHFGTKRTLIVMAAAAPVLGACAYGLNHWYFHLIGSFGSRTVEFSVRGAPQLVGPGSLAILMASAALWALDRSKSTGAMWRSPRVAWVLLVLGTLAWCRWINSTFLATLHVLAALAGAALGRVAAFRALHGALSVRELIDLLARNTRQTMSHVGVGIAHAHSLQQQFGQLGQARVDSLSPGPGEHLACAMCGAELAAADDYCGGCGAVFRAQADVKAEQIVLVERARLLLVGVATLLGCFGVALYILSDPEDGDPAFIGAVPAGGAAVRKIVLLTYLFLAGTMGMLARWTKTQPLAALVTGGAVYTVTALSSFMAGNFSTTILGISLPIVLTLWGGVASALHERNQQRRAAPNCSHSPRWNAAYCHGCGVAVPARARSHEEAGRLAHADGRAPDASALLTVVAMFFLMVGTVLLVSQLRGSMQGPYLSTGAMLVMGCVVMPFCDKAIWSHAMSFSQLSVRTLGLTVTSVIFCGLTLEPYFSYLLHVIGIPRSSTLDMFNEAGWSLGGALVVMSLMPAVVEELVFRGVILGRLRRVTGTASALTVQAVMFSVLHFSPLSLPSHALMGLIFGVVRIRTGSLYPGMVVHALWNAWVVYQDSLRP